MKCTSIYVQALRSKILKTKPFFISAKNKKYNYKNEKLVYKLPAMSCLKPLIGATIAKYISTESAVMLKTKYHNYIIFQI